MRSRKQEMTHVRRRASLATGWWTGCWRFGILGLLLAATAMVSSAQTPEEVPSYSVLYNFMGAADGGNPNAGLIADADGNVYGTAQEGGNTSSSCPYGSLGCGVVFKLDPAGNETVLYAFTGGADGNSPLAGLIRDAAGNLYGTTFQGGNTGGTCGSLGCGVVFKLDPAGNETVLHSFTGGRDGSTPEAALIRDPAGNLYGTAYGGETNKTMGLCAGLPGCGVVFKLDPLRKFTVLYTFTGGADGGYTLSGLIRDPAGNLYGTTQDGGNTSSSCENGSDGCGVVFKIDPWGRETVLYAFTGGADGLSPYAGVVRDRAGNLYGPTGYGGNTSSSCPVGCGVVFKLGPSGKERVLYAFTGGADGLNPFLAGVIRGRAGGLYGTTWVGGDLSCTGLAGSGHGCGVVFKVDPCGKETVLHTFVGTDGANPNYAGSLLSYEGSLYGTTFSGGAYSSASCSGGCGVVFKLR